MSLATLMMLTLGGLLAAGLALLIRGLIGKRIGTDPHCRKCKYNLTGLEADKCPECGSPATGRNVRIGLRKRHRPALFIGAILLLTSLGGFGTALYSRARNVNWYAQWPTSMLAAQAYGGDPSAIREITARLEAGDADGASLTELILTALRQQGLDPRPRGIQHWTNFLAAMDIRSHLTPGEHNTFLNQMGDCRVTFRPSIRQGERFTVNVEWSFWGPTNLPGEFRVRASELSIGDWTGWFSPSSSLPVADGQWSSVYGMTVTDKQFAPGQYLVECQPVVELGHPALVKSFPGVKPLEVLPADAPSQVRLIDDSAMADAFRRAIELTTTLRPPTLPGKTASVSFSIMVSRSDLPMDGAFSLIARIGDQERLVGTLAASMSKGKQPNSKWYFGTSIDAESGETLVPILRSSIPAAEETHVIFNLYKGKPAPMTEIWDGELIYDLVRLERPNPEPAGDVAEKAEAATQPGKPR